MKNNFNSQKIHLTFISIISLNYLIPLIIFPLSFFLIFLGVKNLTVNFPLEKEKITQNDKKEMIKYNQNSEDVEKKIVKEKEQNFVDVDENLKNTKDLIS